MAPSDDSYSSTIILQENSKTGLSTEQIFHRMMGEYSNCVQSLSHGVDCHTAIDNRDIYVHAAFFLSLLMSR
jgi:hypothetical protein